MDDWVLCFLIYICSLALSLDQTYIACEWQTDVKDECFDIQTATVRITRDTLYHVFEQPLTNIMHGEAFASISIFVTAGYILRIL